MFCKRMAAIHKKGRDHLETLREMHRAESERLLGVFGDVLNSVREALDSDQHQDDPEGAEVPPDTTDSVGGDGHSMAERAGRLVLKALEQGGGLDALAAAHERSRIGSRPVRFWGSASLDAVQVTVLLPLPRHRCRPVRPDMRSGIIPYQGTTPSSS